MVITSVSYPTDAVEKFAQLEGWHMVVVADKDTPVDWDLPGVDFLSVATQAELPYRNITLLPWNSLRCTSRLLQSLHLLLSEPGLWS